MAGISAALREDRLDRLDAAPLIHQQLLQAPGDEVQDRLLSLTGHLDGLQPGRVGNALLKVEGYIIPGKSLHGRTAVTWVHPHHECVAVRSQEFDVMGCQACHSGLQALLLCRQAYIVSSDFFGFQNVGCSHCMVSYLQHAVSAASEAEGVSAGAGGLSGGPKADQAV